MPQFFTHVYLVMKVECQQDDFADPPAVGFIKVDRSIVDTLITDIDMVNEAKKKNTSVHAIEFNDPDIEWFTSPQELERAEIVDLVQNRNVLSIINGDQAAVVNPKHWSECMPEFGDVPVSLPSIHCYEDGMVWESFSENGEALFLSKFLSLKVLLAAREILAFPQASVSTKR
jgi:hypothetical protein